jgi:catechol 2,3-dioxygenase-like lactoylglutathione lyase family enzyme
VVVLAVSHVAVGVRDADRQLTFYRDVLGMHVTADKVEEFPQGPGEEPARRRAVYLRWAGEVSEREAGIPPSSDRPMWGPHASFVVLDQQLSREITGEPAQLFQMGCHHFAFWVDDIRPVVERARAAGVDVVMGGEEGSVSDTVMYGEPPGGTVRTVFLRDPEGNYVQLDQRV